MLGAKPRDASVVFFAFGTVGCRIVRFALNYDRSLVSAVVVMPGDHHLADTMRHNEPSLRWIEYDDNRLDTVANEIRALGANICILAWWPRVLTSQFLHLGQEMTLNLHPSLLPHGRGKDPNFWAIVEDGPFGVSIHHVTTEVDDGDIAFQKAIAYDWQDTGKSLYEKATNSIVELFRESYPRIINFDVPRQKQQPNKGSYHKRSELEGASLILLDREYKARELLNLLRARTFAPHPGCRFSDGDSTYEIGVTIKRVEGQ
jgi:methionyl-tRNA formyltransferase